MSARAGAPIAADHNQGWASYKPKLLPTKTGNSVLTSAYIPWHSFPGTNDICSL